MFLQFVEFLNIPIIYYVWVCDVVREDHVLNAHTKSCVPIRKVFGVWHNGIFIIFMLMLFSCVRALYKNIPIIIEIDNNYFICIFFFCSVINVTRVAIMPFMRLCVCCVLEKPQNQINFLMSAWPRVHHHHEQENFLWILCFFFVLLLLFLIFTIAHIYTGEAKKK